MVTATVDATGSCATHKPPLLKLWKDNGVVSVVQERSFELFLFLSDTQPAVGVPTNFLDIQANRERNQPDCPTKIYMILPERIQLALQTAPVSALLHR